MRTILIIGIGAGNPDHLTVQAIEALNRADVFFIPDKGTEKAALRRLREEICRRFVRRDSYRTVTVDIPSRDRGAPNYHDGVEHWHREIEARYRALVETELADGACGAFLVWGDPALYDSTLRIVERIAAGGLAIDYEVIPGISAVQALAARHRVPLNRIGETVLVTTGRKLASGGFPADADSVVVMLDGDEVFSRLAAERLDIYWGAYLGTDKEILVAGDLATVAGEIEAVRRRARKDNGWIMDTYLLRRSGER